MTLPAKWRQRAGGYQLDWDLNTDRAALIRINDNQRIWQGSLLPSLWLQLPDGSKRYAKATIIPKQIEPADERLQLDLTIGDLGTGELRVETLPDGLRFEQLTIQWLGDPAPAIIGVYFGASPPHR